VLHFDSLPLTFEKYYQFIDEYIEIDKGFFEFYKHVSDKDLPFYIVSGGYRQAIQRVLKDCDIPENGIYANDLIMEEHLKPKFASCGSNCDEDIGPCGNCKKECLREIRNITGKKILFIGDGLTDRCAVKISDVVFAKDGLADYCRDLSIDFFEFTDFTDITKELF
jgi:2-hydroxy-3-keto-5-methylthiopentenyl-1-phosphate phosphatase